MTFVGKVLVVVQLVLSVCFMAFAGAVYTAETNWRTKSDQLQSQLTKVQQDLATQGQDLQRITAEKDKQIGDLQSQVALLDDKARTAAEDLKREQEKLVAARTAVDVQTAAATIADENAQARVEEALRQRERNQLLHTQVNGLQTKTRELEDEVFAKNLSIAAMQERQEELITQLENYRNMLLASNLSLNPDDYENLGGDAAEPPPTVTGRVVQTQQSPRSDSEFVEVSLGSDDGFRKGHDLYVYRGDQYLGKITLVSVTPDRAVGRVTQRTRNGQIQKGDNVTPKL